MADFQNTVHLLKSGAIGRSKGWENTGKVNLAEYRAWQTRKPKYRKWYKSDDTADAPLTFPFSDERLPPGLHVHTQVLHHAVNAVVQGQAAGLGLDGLSADGTLVLLFAPLLDAVTAEAVCTVQSDCLWKWKSLFYWPKVSQRGSRVLVNFSHSSRIWNRLKVLPRWRAQSRWCTEARSPSLQLPVWPLLLSELVPFLFPPANSISE